MLQLNMPEASFLHKTDLVYKARIVVDVRNVPNWTTRLVLSEAVDIDAALEIGSEID